MEQFGQGNVVHYGMLLFKIKLMCNQNILKSIHSGKRWDPKENIVQSESSSECETSDCETIASDASRATFDRLMDLETCTNEVDTEFIQPQDPQKYEVPVNAPEDFSKFRSYHQWTPSFYHDSLLDKDFYVSILLNCFVGDPTIIVILMPKFW